MFGLLGNPSVHLLAETRQTNRLALKYIFFVLRGVVRGSAEFKPLCSNSGALHAVHTNYIRELYSLLRPCECAGVMGDV